MDEGPEAVGSGEPGRLDRTVVHEGRILTLSLDRVRFPDGSRGELEMVRHPGASAVLPVAGPRDVPDPEILLLRQYRYAGGGYLWEVPAGMPHQPDESWEACARRELEEETGWKPGKLEHLTRILTTPGFSDEVIHIFLAWELEPGRTRLDDDEFVEVRRLPLSRALAMVRNGDVVDAKSIAALLFAHSFVLGS